MITVAVVRTSTSLACIVVALDIGVVLYHWSRFRSTFGLDDYNQYRDGCVLLTVIFSYSSKWYVTFRARDTLSK